MTLKEKIAKQKRLDHLIGEIANYTASSKKGHFKEYSQGRVLKLTNELEKLRSE
jgi:hypothetical protein